MLLRRKVSVASDKQQCYSFNYLRLILTWIFPTFSFAQRVLDNCLLERKEENIRGKWVNKFEQKFNEQIITKCKSGREQLH